MRILDIVLEFIVPFCGWWLTNSSSVLPTSQLVYQPINHRKVYIIQKTRDFSVGLPAK